MGDQLPLDNNVYRDYLSNVHFTSTVHETVDLESVVIFGQPNPNTGTSENEVYIENTVKDYFYVIENVLNDGNAVNICNITIATSGCFFTEILLCGDNDADFNILINNERKYRYILNFSNPNGHISIGYKRILEQGDNIIITCENTGLSDSAEFTATIIGFLG